MKEKLNTIICEQLTFDKKTNNFILEFIQDSSVFHEVNNNMISEWNIVIEDLIHNGVCIKSLKTENYLTKVYVDSYDQSYIMLIINENKQDNNEPNAWLIW